MKKEEDIALGVRIRTIRNNINMDQKDFSRLINSTVSALSNWENGRNKPKTKTLKRIAELGNTTVDFLIYGSLDDYARNLIKDFEKELHEDDSIYKGAIPQIVSDVENRLFPKHSPRGYNDRESLKKDFNEYKKEAMELWLNYENSDVEISTRIGRQLSDTINNNLGYFHSDFYINEDNSVKSGKKISDRSDEFVKRLQKLDNFQRAYIDSLRFLDNEEMVKELDKIDIYTDNLNKLQ